MIITMMDPMIMDTTTMIMMDPMIMDTTMDIMARLVHTDAMDITTEDTIVHPKAALLPPVPLVLLLLFPIFLPFLLCPALNFSGRF